MTECVHVNIRWKCQFDVKSLLLTTPILLRFTYYNHCLLNHDCFNHYDIICNYNIISNFDILKILLYDSHLTSICIWSGLNLSSFTNSFYHDIAWEWTISIVVISIIGFLLFQIMHRATCTHIQRLVYSVPHAYAYRKKTYDPHLRTEPTHFLWVWWNMLTSSKT